MGALIVTVSVPEVIGESVLPVNEPGVAVKVAVSVPASDEVGESESLHSSMYSSVAPDPEVAVVQPAPVARVGLPSAGRVSVATEMVG